MTRPKYLVPYSGYAGVFHIRNARNNIIDFKENLNLDMPCYFHDLIN